MRSPTLLLAFTLTACATSPVPTDQFYRLEDPLQDALATTPRTLLDGVLTVQPLRTDGLHRERALLYSEDPRHRALRQYHYHFWLSPPPRLVQDYIVAYLRAMQTATIVVADDRKTDADYVVQGRLKNFEQRVMGDKSRVVVSLELRLQQHGERRPQLLQVYESNRHVPSGAVADSIFAYEDALAQIMGRFLEDVQSMLLSSPLKPLSPCASAVSWQ